MESHNPLGWLPQRILHHPLASQHIVHHNHQVPCRTSSRLHQVLNDHSQPDQSLRSKPPTNNSLCFKLVTRLEPSRQDCVDAMRNQRESQPKKGQHRVPRTQRMADQYHQVLVRRRLQIHQAQIKTQPSGQPDSSNIMPTVSAPGRCTRSIQFHTATKTCSEYFIMAWRSATILYCFTGLFLVILTYIFIARLVNMSQRSSTYSPDFRCPSIGSTANSALSRDDAQRLYETSQQRLSQTQDQLKYAMLVRTSSPLSPIDMRRNDMDIANISARLAQIQSEIEFYKEQIRTRDDIILRQQATIKNQSKAIENPRPGRDFPGTPRHSNGNGGGYGLPQGQAAPPPFNFQGQYSSYIPGQPSMPTYGHIPTSSTGTTFPPSNAGSWSMYGSNSTGNTPRAKFPSGTINVNQYGSPEKHMPAPPGTPSFQYGTANQTMNYGYNYQTPMHDPFGPVQPNSGPHVSSADGQQYQSWQSFATPDSFISNPYPETSMPITNSHMTASDAANEGRLKEQIQKVFDMAQKYAQMHANFPSTAGDNALPQEIKDRLLNAATPATAFSLMTDPKTRYLLVSKITLAWIIKHILKFNTFSGLDKDIDEIISGAKATIYQSTPAQLRYLVLTSVAHEVKKLRDRPEFGAYVEHLCHQRATQLLKILRPTMHNRPQNEAQDLVALLREAYKLAELMFTGTDEFSFNFHNFGCAFDGAEMVCVDSYAQGVSAAKLKEVKASVRLGATPLVRVRKNTAHGEVQEHVLVLAKVLLRRMN